MIRTKWSVGLRNKLSSLAMECDSCAAEGAISIASEREELKKMISKVVNYIDKKIR